MVMVMEMEMELEVAHAKIHPRLGHGLLPPRQHDDAPADETQKHAHVTWKHPSHYIHRRPRRRRRRRRLLACMSMSISMPTPR